MNNAKQDGHFKRLIEGDDSEPQCTRIYIKENRDTNKGSQGNIMGTNTFVKIIYLVHSCTQL